MGEEKIIGSSDDFGEVLLYRHLVFLSLSSNSTIDDVSTCTIN